MDYDDSDFENQNLHLAGEDSTKFPPALRPYTLPKFDFDESLRANLRFDSLVEAEVFLGIESNEDNQWIDAFSRGGSNVEFSSAAADSCSISRYDNVWSEATSSESVEMLLKSVGQGEYNPRQTVIQESDACDELACLAKQMDSNPKPYDRNEFKDNVTDLHVGINTGDSRSPEGKLPVDGSSGILEPNDMFRNVDLPMSEGSPALFTYNGSNITNQREVETVADVSDHGKSHESTLVVETNITESSMQSMVYEQHGSQQTQINNKNLEGSTTKEEPVVDTQCLDQNAVSVDANNADKSLFSIPPQDSLERQSVVKGPDTGLSSLKYFIRMGTDVIYDMQKEERCSEDMCSRDLTQANASENLILLKDMEKDDESVPDACISPKVSVKDDSGNSKHGIYPNLQKTVNVIENITYGVSNVFKENASLNTGGDHMDRGVLSSMSDSSMLPAKVNNISVVSEGNYDNRVGGFSGFSLVASSTNSSIVEESTPICVNNEPDRQSDLEKIELDVSVNHEENTRIHADSCQTHYIAQCHLGDKGVVSLPLSAGSMDSGLTTSTASINVKPVNNSASQVISENISLTSCEITNDPPPSEVVSINRASDVNDIQRITTAESSSAEGKEEIAMKITEEAGIPALVRSSEQETAPFPVEETEILHPSGPSRHLICDMASDSVHDVVTLGAAKIGEPQRTIDEKLTQECTKEGAVPPFLCESSALVGFSELKTAPCPVKETKSLHPSGMSGHLMCDMPSYSMHDSGTHVAVKMGEPLRTIDEKVTQECTKEISMPPVLCESSEKQGDGVTISVIMDGKSSSKELGGPLLGNQDSISSAPLPESRVELLETGSFPASTICSPSSKFRSPSQIKKDENRVKASANQKPATSDLKDSRTHNGLSTAQVLERNTAFKDERSSTPEVNLVVDLSKKVIVDLDIDVSKRQSSPVITTSNASIALVESPSTSGLGPSKTKSLANVPHGSPQMSVGEVAFSASKATPKRKARQSSNKEAGKESARRGRAKNASPARQSGKSDKSTKISLSSSPGFELMQQQYGHVDSNSAKAFSLVNTSSSSLPDLNTSASPSALFHQPFTDLQQVQLRAQILVYGALIQDTAPDEAHMLSAYGGTDGGRSIWENVWRVYMDRKQCQKSHPITPETPLQSKSVARTSDSKGKQIALQGKGISSPLGRASSNTTTTIGNSLMPLSSPLWSLPTLSCDSLQTSALARGSVVDYSHTLTPMHPYQSPPVSNFIGHNPSRISQASFRGSWIGSPTPVPDNGTHLSASPSSDTIKLCSLKGSSLPSSSSMKNVTLGPPASIAGLQSSFAGTTSQLDANNVRTSPAQHSSVLKPKKRKKAPPSEDLSQKPLQSLTPAVGNHVSDSVSVVIPVGNVPISSVERSVLSVSPLADQPINDQTVEKMILSDDSVTKVKEARVHAEEASAHSAAAVNHCLELWNQLDKHKNSALMSDIEATLASAAVAVAAAAAVAKAAAAAANVASNAAFQAKLMADEALISSGCENFRQSNKVFLSEGTSNMGQATPASILKGASVPNCPGSIIVVAKEAIKKRVQEASAATKRAENMDAILKAAELAAEAVSQAGKIVTMGDPLPLIELIEGGPEGCWKASRESSREVGLLNDMTRDLVNIDIVRDIPESSHIQNNYISSSGISASIMSNEKNSRGQMAHNVSDLVKHVDVVPGSEPEIQVPSITVRNRSENLEENTFKEGSLVEVFKDEEGYKAAWFIANILSLKDGNAYVCYTSLVAVQGPLKEWVSLAWEGDKPPRIRIARPPTSLRHEGTRKRRRAAMGDYVWSVGDRVDAWIQESWQEGVITEKNKKDGTTLTVHIPASGETSVLRSWHLRPSLIWKDGKWLEFSKVEASDSSTHEGDSPLEKRPKLGSNAVEVKGKDKMSESIVAAESANPEEMKFLNLTENDKMFNIGKSSKNESKQDALRLVRSGLQKEGSKVIFGVPKPGKKRKFMEVSKHYVAHGSNKANDKNDLVQIGSELRGWRNSSKNDTKEKLGANSKPKTKFGKPQGVLGRVNPPTNISVSNAVSLSTDPAGHTEMTKDSSNHFKSASHSESQVERALDSNTDRATQVPIVFSAPATSMDTLPTKGTVTSSKGRLARAGDKLRKGGGAKALNSKPSKSTSEADVHEPRRSNRRIQPTSRLLEGLQSSLIVSKIPSVSQNRNIPKGNNHQG